MRRIYFLIKWIINAETEFEECLVGLTVPWGQDCRYRACRAKVRMQTGSNPGETGRKMDVPIQINDRLQVILIGTDEEVPTTYLTRVEDLESDGFWIAWPTHAGIRATLRNQDRLSITFAEQGCVYRLTGRVIQRVFEPLPLIRVLPDEKAERVQRREFVRVPAMVEIRLFSLVTAEAKEEDAASVNLIATRTINISGGGFLIHHTAAPRLGSIYEVKFQLPTEKEPMKLRAKVVRCESVLDPLRGKYYAVGFAFIQIQEYMRRRIISFVFRFQQTSV
jgi:c-di-GMP-binding flagellar brake protein YcgR